MSRSLWRKRIKDGDQVGIKAKTVYPAVPASWALNDHGQPTPWPPDKVLSLVQAGMLNGKSIGFQVLKGHSPDTKECAKNGWDPNSVRYVIDEWLLLEYACCFLPANQEALVEAVSKGLQVDDAFLRALGLDGDVFRELQPAGGANAGKASAVPFTSLAEVEKAVTAAITAIDFEQMAHRATEEAWARARGRV